jgi:hypothetical protein
VAVTRRAFLQAIAGVAVGAAVVGPAVSSVTKSAVPTVAVDWGYDVTRCVWYLRNGGTITFFRGFVVTDEELDDDPALARRLRIPRPSPASSLPRSRAGLSRDTPG